MLLDYMLIPVTLFVLALASYTDIKYREVPDWINYGLIIAALGLRIIFAWDQGIEILINGLMGLGICFGLACLFYYSHQWGGGDSKLLMGMGLVIGVTYPLNLSSLNLLWYFVTLLLVGAAYGLLWMFYLALKNVSLFWPKFRAILLKFKLFHLGLGLLSFVFIVLSFYNSLFWILVPFPLGLFYLFVFVNSIEQGFFVKSIPTNKLVEGDWLAYSVYLKGKKIMDKKTLEKEDLSFLKKLYHQNKLDTVKVKEGVPFIPSFLLSYVLFIFWPHLIKGFFEVFLG